MKTLRRLARIELVLIYLVIIAGSVVRMTGSGMGCPDWPKCFGYLIPPTEHAQLEWQADYDYAKGQIIIVDKSLRVANSDFTSAKAYTSSNWAPYTKHDYALFNPFHTWTEYVNRLIGALAGIPMLLLLVLSLLKIRRKPMAFVLSLAGLFMLGFEAWLGKLVVDGNLIPGSITIHMLGALILIAILLVLLRVLREDHELVNASVKFKGLLWFALLIGLAQIIWGTQIREQVDHLNEAGILRANWMDVLDWHFYLHRSFSILVALVHAGLFYLGWKNAKLARLIKALVAIIFMEILLGIVLSYFEFPKWAQPSHLLLATFMFGFHVYLLTLAVWPLKKG
jgi:cytochrome c oxidase assembly protein subunit 15